MLSLHGALLPDFSEGDHAPMKELTIGRNDAGQRLDRFLAKAQAKKAGVQSHVD